MWMVEWLKLKRYRPFWVLMALYPICLVGIFWILHTAYHNLVVKGLPADAAFASSPLAFPAIWHNLTYLASFFHFFPCALILLNVCNEFEFRTHRQNLLDGWSRLQFFAAKVGVAAGVVLLCTLWVVALGLVVGLSNGGSPLQGSEFLAYFLLQSAVYAAFSLWLGFFFRKGLVALAVFLVYANLLETIVAAIASHYIPSIGQYFPLAAVNHLILFPTKLPEAFTAMIPAVPVLAGCGGVYVVLFLGTSWWRFHRQDL